MDKNLKDLIFYCIVSFVFGLCVMMFIVANDNIWFHRTDIIKAGCGYYDSTTGDFKLGHKKD